jgi:hypothetical protein
VWKRVAIRHSREFLKHVIPAVLKPARILWNEVIGFLFLVFGVIFGVHAVRYAMAGDTSRLCIAGFCTLVMAGYGVSSFLRARRISRS